MPVRILRHMVQTLLIIASLAAARPLAAQEGTRMAGAGDSLARVQDSVLYFSNAAIAHDSTLVEEYQKLTGIYKARKRFEEELKIAQAMVAANPASAIAYFSLG